MENLKNKVQCDVTRLLSILEPSCDLDTFEFVRNKLTQMVILSVAPPNCQNQHGRAGRSAAPGGDDPYGQKKLEQDKHNFGEFSFNKEKFIAP